MKKMKQILNINSEIKSMLKEANLYETIEVTENGKKQILPLEDELIIFKKQANEEIFKYLKNKAKYQKNLEFCYRFIFDAEVYRTTKKWNEYYVRCKIDGFQNQCLGDILAMAIKPMLDNIGLSCSYIDFYVYFCSSYSGKYAKYKLYRLFKKPEIKYNIFINHTRG